MISTHPSRVMTWRRTEIRCYEFHSEHTLNIGLTSSSSRCQNPKHPALPHVTCAKLGHDTASKDKCHAVVNRITQKPDKCPCPFPITLVRNMINIVAPKDRIKTEHDKTWFPGTGKLVIDVRGFCLAVAPGNHSLHFPSLKVSVSGRQKDMWG